MLLREYTEHYASLAFLGKPRNADALAAALAQAKSRFAENIGREFWCRRDSISIDPEFYRAGHGFAGAEPETLLQTYCALLEAQGMETYLRPIFHPFSYLVKNAKVDKLHLLRLGGSYIVAGSFTVERIATLPVEEE